MNTDHTTRIIAFLRGIGLDVREQPLDGPAFLPGIRISAGALIVDRCQLAHPGDLLHEAGHLACKTPADRALADDKLPGDGGEEMAAIGWSYAAAMHIGIPVEVLFHPAGYRGGASSLIENFAAGRYLGVPLLQWFGLTADEKRAAELAVAPYPAMQRWLRE